MCAFVTEKFPESVGLGPPFVGRPRKDSVRTPYRLRTDSGPTMEGPVLMLRANPGVTPTPDRSWNDLVKRTDLVPTPEISRNDLPVVVIANNTNQRWLRDFVTMDTAILTIDRIKTKLILKLHGLMHKHSPITPYPTLRRQFDLPSRGWALSLQ